MHLIFFACLMGQVRRQALGPETDWDAEGDPSSAESPRHGELMQDLFDFSVLGKEPLGICLSSPASPARGAVALSSLLQTGQSPTVPDTWGLELHPSVL